MELQVPAAPQKIGRLLVVTQYPSASTGLGRAAQNLLPLFAPHFERIDIWAIGYNGYPGPGALRNPWNDPPFRLFPATDDETHWYNASRLQALISHLNHPRSDYTHVWIHHDHFPFCHSGFPHALKRLCEERKIQTSHWIGVDCPLQETDGLIVAAVDEVATYTNYGRTEIGKRVEREVAVIPLGVDPKVYRPLEDREAVRKELFKGWLKPGDKLLVNVNQNQRRKDPVRSLELLAKMRLLGWTNLKLLMHMAEVSLPPCEIHLEKVGRQLGLEPGEHWRHSGDTFNGAAPRLSEEDLNKIYNAADALVSTSLGEGWGLSVTEAFCAGCPVAVPDHTGCGEIVRWLRIRDTAGIVFNLEEGHVALAADCSRLRRRIALDDSARVLGIMLKFGGRTTVCEETRETLSWAKIADQWLEIFRRGKPVKVASDVDARAMNAPVIRQQIRESGIFNFPLAPGDIHFNCACIEAEGQTWLVARTTQRGQNRITFHRINRGRNEVRPSHFIADQDRATHLEDPRIILNPLGGFDLSVVTYRQREHRDAFWCHQQLMRLNKHLHPEKNAPVGHLEYGNNGRSIGANIGHEKNWTWFYPTGADQPALHCLYKIEPFTVLRVDQEFRAEVEHRGKWNHRWKFGPMRGGTPPVLLGGEWWVFFHSSVNHSSVPMERRYFMGALAFRFDGLNDPVVTRYTPEPLLVGSAEEALLPWSPRVVFPSGAIWEEEAAKWYVTMGINDAACAWVRIAHEELAKQCVEVER